MTHDKSLFDRMQDPKTQANFALERARFADRSEAAASWAVAAAVFSLRDTVERATTPPAMVDPGQLTPEEIESIRRGPSGYVPVVEPDPSRLTPEEAAAIRRWTVYPHGPFPFTRTDMGFADQALADEARRTQDALNCARDLMSRHLGVPLGGRVGSQATRPAVTREQVAMAITDASDHCRGSKLACNLTHLCPCYRQVAAVMKLLEGGE